MKTEQRALKLIFTLLTCFACLSTANAQFLKKLGKRAEKAAERAVERRVDKEATEKTDQALDSILEPGSKKTQTPKVQKKDDSNTNTPNNGTSSDPNHPGKSEGPKSLTVYSKFDFVPGDEQLFYDDFANDFVGDFPSKWNTNGSGEVVTLGEDERKWFEMKPGRNLFMIPDIDTLPEEYTITFDMATTGLDNKTSSQAKLNILISDNKTFEMGRNFVQAAIPLCQYIAIAINMENAVNGKRELYSNLTADLRETVLQQTHFSVAVNKERYRLYINEQKFVDIPRAVPAGNINTLKFNVEGLENGKDRIFITNLKVAKGGEDLRRKLLADGKISTNAILFNSGSDELKPESMGVIRQIFQVLQQDSSISLKIVGHTDSDGDDKSNLALSKKRAEAVKSALVSVYGVDSNRLSTDGKGESEPVGDNNFAEGKAQNRRVEFIKQ